MTSIRLKVPSKAEPEWRETFLEFVRAKDEAKRAEGVWRDHQSTLVERWSEEDRKSFTTTDGDVKVSGSLIAGTETHVDEDRLKKALGAVEFNKLTKRVLDPTKVSAAIERGDLDPAVVAECSYDKPKRPYIRVSVKQA